MYLQTCCARQPVGFVVPTIGKFLVFLILLETIALYTLCTLLYIYPDESGNELGIVYATLGIICTTGFLYFGIDAVLVENKFQFIAFHVVTWLLTIFFFIESIRNGDKFGPIWEKARWPILSAVCTFQGLYTALAVPVYRSFGFYAYKVVGGSVPLLRAYTRLRAFLTLLRGDILMCILVLALAKEYLISDESVDFFLGLIFLICTIISAFIAWRAMRTENRLLALFFAIFSLFQPVFIGYKLWSLWTKPGLLPEHVSFFQFLAVGGLAVIVRCSMVALTLRCTRDFGIGLRDMVFESERSLSRYVSRGPNYFDRATGGRHSYLHVFPDDFDEPDPTQTFLEGTRRYGYSAEEYQRLVGAPRSPFDDYTANLKGLQDSGFGQESSIVSSGSTTSALGADPLLHFATGDCKKNSLHQPLIAESVDEDYDDPIELSEGWGAKFRSAVANFWKPSNSNKHPRGHPYENAHSQGSKLRSFPGLDKSTSSAMDHSVYSASSVNSSLSQDYNRTRFHPNPTYPNKPIFSANNYSATTFYKDIAPSDGSLPNVAMQKGSQRKSLWSQYSPPSASFDDNNFPSSPTYGY